MTGNPTNGGVDLGALRGPSKRHRDAMVNSMLNQQGLACPCGERIREQGVSLYLMTREQLVPTEQGMQLGVQMMNISFHSIDCPALHANLSAPRQESDPQPMAIKALPPVQWIDEAEPA